MKVSIIIVNFNTCNLLRDCLHSVYEYTKGISFEIIIVDNASNDNSVEMIENTFPDVKLIKSIENLGFGKANNLGIDKSDGEFLFFLNSDTTLLNNVLKILSDYLLVNKNAGVVGGNLYSNDGTPTHSFSRLLPGFLTELDQILRLKLTKLLFGENSNFNYTNRPLEVSYITGADMMVRKSIINEVGGFDPDFFLYYEETELTFRIKKKGWGIFSIPAAKIIHHNGASSNNSLKKDKFYFDSSIMYYKKVYSNPIIRLILFVSYVKVILALIKNVIRNKKMRINYWKNQMYLLKNI